jgi:benzoyl-CoA reductase/2-hydroxyglutaryl-CoA dehydratase subunit BcrC/BadD/HgdB
MADYHKMWEGLGMDLATHDQLCAALPPAFEQVFLTQEDRPHGMDYFNMVIAEVHGLRIQELLDHKARGGKIIGSFCIYVPEEIVLALDGIMVGLCAGSEFWVPAGEQVLPRSLCPLIKAGIGAKVSKTCPYFQSVDLVVGENTCDGKKKAWEVLGDMAPTYVMDLPNTKGEIGFSLFRRSMADLVKKLEEVTGTRLTFDRLLSAIETVDRKRGTLARLYETRKAPEVPISGLDMLLASQVAFYDDAERFISQANSLSEECEERVEAGKAVFPEGTKRLLVTGTPIVVPNWKVHKIIETSGAAVVVEENCTGTRYFESRVDIAGASTVEELVDAIAHRYFDRIHCACFTPNEGRADDVVRLVHEYGADGVVGLNLSFCTTYQVENEKLRKHLQEKGIPFLPLETDYASGDEGQLRTRIEAFVESLGSARQGQE